MIYIHIPFCRSFCTYCDFYSEAVPKCAGKQTAVHQEALFEGFENALSKEIIARKDELSRDVNTLYIGGGTPSVLPLSFFRNLVSILEKAGAQGPYSEFTVEVNPEDVAEKGISYIQGLKELGVNRISMGVQSFDDSILRWMNRRHDSKTAIEAYSIIQAAGIENISIDLIFGMPQLSEELWCRTIDSALSISSSGKNPAHISAYQLSVEPGSALAKLMSRGAFEEAEEALCSRQYDILCSKLRDAGYHHYEISNFALPGMEAVHNSAYWSHTPYVGFGPGAHSFVIDGKGDRVRKWNKQNLQAYISASEHGFETVVESETLSDEQFYIEEIMLSLRTAEGIDKQRLSSHADMKAVASLLDSCSLVETALGRIRIPENHFFVSDNILADII